MTSDTESIQYRETHEIDLGQLADLMRSAGWNERAADRSLLERQVSGARYVISAWEGPRLVGFVRAISDGATNAYVSTVVVLPGYQGRGIGRAMMQRLLAGRNGIRFVLHVGRPEVKGFYEKLGFSEATDMMRWGRIS